MLDLGSEAAWVLIPLRVTFCQWIFFHVVKPLMPILPLLSMLSIYKKTRLFRQNTKKKKKILNEFNIECNINNDTCVNVIFNTIHPEVDHFIHLNYYLNRLLNYFVLPYGSNTKMTTLPTLPTLCTSGNLDYVKLPIQGQLYNAHLNTQNNKIAFQWDAYRPLIDRISQHALPGGSALLEGGGVSLPGGICLAGGGYPSTPLWTEFLTHATENITLPQTSFAGGYNTKRRSDAHHFQIFISCHLREKSILPNLLKF